MQTSVEDSLTRGLPGQLADIANNEIVCAANYSKQLDKVDITAANAATTLTINGTAFTDSSTSKTKAEMAESIAGLVNAGSEPVTAYYTTGNEYLTVESNTPGTAMTCVGTTNCTVTAQIANAAAIDFGLLVVRDSMDEDKARVPIVAADITTANNLFGITVRTQTVENNYGANTNPGYALDSPMSIARKARIYVEVEDAVLQGGTVYVRHTASGTEKLGAFRSDADGTDASILPNAVYETSASAGNVAIVSINLP